MSFAAFEILSLTKKHVLVHSLLKSGTMTGAPAAGWPQQMRLKQCPNAVGSVCQHLAVFRKRGRAPTQARLSQVNALSAGCIYGNTQSQMVFRGLRTPS